MSFQRVGPRESSRGISLKGQEVAVAAIQLGVRGGRVCPSEGVPVTIPDRGVLPFRGNTE